MSLSIAVGAKALVQLGVSLGDIALIVRAGRIVGNWLHVRANDEDLFTVLEDAEVLLKRRGIVDPPSMERKYSKINFIYQAGRVSNTSQQPQRDDGNHASELPHSQRTAAAAESSSLRPFSWLMIIIITTLDCFMSRDRIVEFIIELLVHIIDDREMESSVRVSIRVNIESWRSAGRARGMCAQIQKECRAVWRNCNECDAIPQLNSLEDHEAQRFLRCLLEDTPNDFTCYCASTLALAKALSACGVTISVGSKRAYEEQLLVTYVEAGKELHRVPSAPPQLQPAEMVSYLLGRPEGMIEAMVAERPTKDRMNHLWQLGADAARGLKLVACSSDLSDAISSEAVYYELGPYNDKYSKAYGVDIQMLSQKAFPLRTQGVFDGVQELLKCETDEMKTWLIMHAGEEYLLRGNTKRPDPDKRPLYLYYQSLVFGFYYSLLAHLVCHDFLDSETPYCRGVWGHDGTTLLAMCTQFGSELLMQRRVSRTHVVYMLAAMYGGRSKVYKPEGTRPNVLGVLGPVSILALHLLKPTDQPEALMKFVVLDLPICHLVPEDDGDLLASSDWNIKLRAPSQAAMEIHPRSASGKWSVHSSMATVLRGGGSGVVLGARCDGRLAGWFSPTAAVRLFLSAAYVRGDVDGDNPKDTPIKGFEVTEGDFKEGEIPAPMRSEGEEAVFGVVQSAGSAIFRYAAAGLYGSSGEEVAIANGNLLAAFERVEAQGRGVVIS